MNFFGYYSRNQIISSATRIKKEHDLFQGELSKRIQKNYYEMDIFETQEIATKVHSMNPIGEFLINLLK